MNNKMIYTVCLVALLLVVSIDPGKSEAATNDQNQVVKQQDLGASSSVYNFYEEYVLPADSMTIVMSYPIPNIPPVEQFYKRINDGMEIRANGALGSNVTYYKWNGNKLCKQASSLSRAIQALETKNSCPYVRTATLNDEWNEFPGGRNKYKIIGVEKIRGRPFTFTKAGKSTIVDNYDALVVKRGECYSDKEIEDSINNGVFGDEMIAALKKNGNCFVTYYYVKGIGFVGSRIDGEARMVEVLNSITHQ